MIPIYEFDNLTPERILNRKIQEEENVSAAVDAVIADVRKDGDAALRAYTKRFDGVDMGDLQVSESELEAAWTALEPDFIETLRMAAENIRRFHERQVHQDFELRDREIMAACRAANVPCNKKLLGMRAQGIAICRSGQLTITPADQQIHFDEFLHGVLAPPEEFTAWLDELNVK